MSEEPDPVAAAAESYLKHNPDNIPVEFLGAHVMHRTRRMKQNLFMCLDCKVKWSMVRPSVLKRRKLLR